MTKPGLPLKERIQNSIVIDDNGCWIWQNYLDSGKYGVLCIAKSMVRAHRASYEAYVGPIPEGLQTDHLCRVTSCVNPEHLEPVTQQENLRRKAIANTHCPQGHEYNEQNTYWQVPQAKNLNPSKKCKACSNIHGRGYRLRRKAQQAQALTTIST